MNTFLSPSPVSYLAWLAARGGYLLSRALLARPVVIGTLVAVGLWLVALDALADPPRTSSGLQRHKLILDWFPNADHVPLYVARDAGFFQNEGLKIELVPPADPNDPLKLVAAGRASFGINYQPNVIIARSEGLPVRSIGVLVERPLSSLAYLKSNSISTPADLRGKRIGYSVQALQLALLKALAASGGVTPAEYETINVNFNFTASLLSGQVDAVIGAFWNYELAELELEGVAGGYLALEEHGIPDYYELVVITSDTFDNAHPGTSTKLVNALNGALTYTRVNPKQALEIYLAANPQAKAELDRRAFELTRPVFARTQTQSREKWERFNRFALEQGLIETAVPTDDLFRNR